MSNTAKPVDLMPSTSYKLGSITEMVRRGTWPRLAPTAERSGFSLQSLEEESQVIERVLSRVWEAEWRRADYMKWLTETYPKPVIHAIMGVLGRSHRCAYRWAEQARRFPPDQRAQDRSPRWHQEQWNRLGDRWTEALG